MYRRITKGIVVLLLLVTTSCGLLGGESCSRSKFGTVRLALPSRASDVAETCSSGVAASYEVTFNFPAANVTDFQRRTHITNWQMTVDPNSRFKDKAAALKSLLAGSHSDGALYEDVLIDTSNPQQYRVYYYAQDID